MADEMTPGEIRRTLERIERSQHDAQRAVDDRLTKLAADMVPTTLWAAEHKALSDDVRDLEADTRDGFARAEATAQERNQALRGEMKTLRAAQAEHVKQHETDHSWSRSKTLTIIGIVVAASATIVGAWIAAFAAAGGAK